MKNEFRFKYLIAVIALLMAGFTTVIPMAKKYLNRHFTHIVLLLGLMLAQLSQAEISDPVAMAKAVGFKGCDTALGIAINTENFKDKKLKLVPIYRPEIKNQISFIGSYYDYDIENPVTIQITTTNDGKKCHISKTMTKIGPLNCLRDVAITEKTMSTTNQGIAPYITNLNATVLIRKSFEDNGGQQIVINNGYSTHTPVEGGRCLVQNQTWSEIFAD